MKEILQGESVASYNPMEQDYRRQRTSLFVTASLLLVFALGDAKIEALNPPGVRVVFDNPSIAFWAVWALFLYYLYRYYIFWVLHRDENFRKKYNAEFFERIVDRLPDILKARNQGVQQQLRGHPNANLEINQDWNVHAPRIGKEWKIKFRVTDRQTKGVYLDSNQVLSELEFPKESKESWRKVALKSPLFTNDYFPFLYAGVTFVTAIWVDWPGNFIRIIFAALFGTESK